MDEKEENQGYARPELLGQGKRRGTLSRKDAMTSDLRPIQRYRNESNVIYTVFLGCHNVTVSTSIGRLLSSLSICLGNGLLHSDFCKD